MLAGGCFGLLRNLLIRKKEAVRRNVDDAWAAQPVHDFFERFGSNWKTPVSEVQLQRRRLHSVRWRLPKRLGRLAILLAGTAKLSIAPVYSIFGIGVDRN